MKVVSGNILKGIFLVILSALGHPAVESTFSKQALKLIRTNYIAKHIIIIALLYFASDFTDEVDSHPVDTLKQTMVIWLFYIIMSKQTLYFTVANLSLLAILYVLYNYKDYYEEDMKEGSQDKEGKDYKELLEENNKYITIVTYSLVFTCVVGFIYYYIKQRKERKHNFNHPNFILGSKLGKF